MEDSSSKKLNTELLYDPAIPLLGIHSKEVKTGIQTNTSTHTFIAALLTTQQPKGGNNPNVHQWINKM